MKYKFSRVIITVIIITVVIYLWSYNQNQLGARRKANEASLKLSLSMASSSHTAVKSYYPEGFFKEDDATSVSWAHAVNSLSLLEASLISPSISMLEADILMGKLTTDKNEMESEVEAKLIPIMAHPPDTESNLSFDKFLDKIIQHNSKVPLALRKGIKLDFKETPAALKVLPVIKQKISKLTAPFPIWINADILPGPVEALPVPFTEADITALINLQKESVPNATLSLGWTTHYPQGELVSASYTSTQFEQMATLLKSVSPSGSVTFPVRAAFILNSVEALLNFLDHSGINSMSPSVTLWEGKGDKLVSEKELNHFIEAVGKARVFLDLPYSFN